MGDPYLLDCSARRENRYYVPEFSEHIPPIGFDSFIRARNGTFAARGMDRRTHAGKANYKAQTLRRGRERYSGKTSGARGMACSLHRMGWNRIDIILCGINQYE